jgi:hypothetical protein
VQASCVDGLPEHGIAINIAAIFKYLNLKVGGKDLILDRTISIVPMMDRVNPADFASEIQ